MNRDATYIFVPGIEYDLDVDGWCDRALEWCIIRGIPALSHEYHAGWWSRWVRQNKRAVELAEQCDRVQNPIPVGHSNGCDVIRRALAYVTRPVQAVHLFAGAAPADCNKNGINAAILSGKVGHVHVYGSEDDWVLKRPAKWTRWLTLGFAGYGDIGYAKPQNVDPRCQSRITIDWRPGYGHSSWLHDADAMDASLGIVTRRGS